MAAAAIISVKPESWSLKKTSLSLEINNTCVLSCPSCFLNRNSELESKVLTDEDFLFILEKALRSEQFDSIILHGQEPTASPELVCKLLTKHRSLQKQGIGVDTSFGFITSGIGANKLVSLLNEANVKADFISVSIDGADKEANALMRNDETAFQKAIDGANQLLTVVKDSSQFCITATASNENAEHLSEMIDLLQTHNWQNLFISPIVTPDENNLFQPDISEKMFEQAIDSCAQKATGTNIKVQAFTVDHPYWGRKITEGMSRGEVRAWPKGKATVLRGPSLDECVIRIRFDGGVLDSAQAILTTTYQPTQFISPQTTFSFKEILSRKSSKMKV